MNYRLIARRALRVLIPLIVLAIACGAFAGVREQFSRADTAGRQIETVIQMAGGLLGLLVVLTCFRGRRAARAVRVTWAASLAATAGLSSLVWGPPMLGIGLLFAGATLLIALGLIRALRVAFAES